MPKRKNSSSDTKAISPTKRITYFYTPVNKKAKMASNEGTETMNELKDINALKITAENKIIMQASRHDMQIMLREINNENAQRFENKIEEIKDTMKDNNDKQEVTNQEFRTAIKLSNEALADTNKIVATLVEANKDDNTNKKLRKNDPETEIFLKELREETKESELKVSIYNVHIDNDDIYVRTLIQKLDLEENCKKQVATASIIYQGPFTGKDGVTTKTFHLHTKSANVRLNVIIAAAKLTESVKFDIIVPRPYRKEFRKQKTLRWFLANTLNLKATVVIHNIYLRTYIKSKGTEGGNKRVFAEYIPTIKDRDNEDSEEEDDVEDNITSENIMDADQDPKVFIPTFRVIKKGNIAVIRDCSRVILWSAQFDQFEEGTLNHLKSIIDEDDFKLINQNEFTETSKIALLWFENSEKAQKFYFKYITQGKIKAPVRWVIYPQL